jgi:hypothetical protein
VADRVFGRAMNRRRLLCALSACTLAACAQPDTEDGVVLPLEKLLTSNQPGRKAVPVGAGATTTEVWEVTTDWSDTTSAAAQAAGMAWPANSGLRWDEKYALWVESMSATTAQNGTKTFIFTTPYGKSLPMPALECSEVALLLRAAFASWYGLPYFAEGSSGSTRVYLGHFGFRTAVGRVKGSPYFRTYSDYSGRGAGAVANWPHDPVLAARHLTAADGNDWLKTGAGFGAWADEAFLNKRFGYFALYLLDYFGSMNLADAVNSIQLVPQALRTGDYLLERWQRIGTGHTLVLKDLAQNSDGTYTVTVAAGGIPRKQPTWDDPVLSRDFFLRPKSGGPGNAADGTPFAALGGGLHRFRIAEQTVDGYWRNDVAPWDQALAIPETDLVDIAARTTTFASLLEDVPPAQKLQNLLAEIATARTNLRQHPASCTNRSDRESFFAQLVALQQSQGISAADTDRQYRATEDYYFPELDYGKSPTCCWDSTTPAMFSIIDGYNRSREAAAAQCLTPVPFRKANYAVFRSYAQSIGSGADWLAWRQDETCPQAGNADDTALASAATPYCSIQADLDAAGR